MQQKKSLEEEEDKEVRPEELPAKFTDGFKRRWTRRKNPALVRTIFLLSNGDNFERYYE